VLLQLGRAYAANGQMAEATAAYRKAMRGCPAYPASKLQAKALLDFFTLEKAVYEVGYELANRPEWVAIPLNGILRVLSKLGGDGNAASPQP